MKLEKMTSRVRRAIEDYQMIEENDKIAIGLSGGKDSVAMLMVLNHLKRFYPKKFELVAITVDLGFEEGFDTSSLRELCQKLQVPYYVVTTQISEIVFEKRQDMSHCYLCAKLRKGALNDLAKELGCNKIAYAHHKDDAIQTLLLSMLFEGQINCFDPVTKLEKSGLILIRPMIYVYESEVVGFRYKYDIPVVKNPCPNNGNSKREYVKQLVTNLHKEDPEFKKRLFSSLTDGHLKAWIPYKDREN